MGLHYGIHQPLRLYEKREHQNRFRKDGSVKAFRLLMPSSHILPFQIKRPGGLFSIRSIKLVATEDGTETELIDRVEDGQIAKYPFQTYDYLVHFGSAPLSTPLPEGEYDLEISDGINVWYSEVITVRNFDPESLSAEGCAVTKITWYDTCDVADIFYRTSLFGGPQYKNFLYLDVDVAKPEYNYNEEGDENGEGVFEADYQRLEKQHGLQTVLPEYMVDAVTLLPLHVTKTGTVEVLTARGYTGEVDRISVDPKWQGTIGTWALTDILFSTEFVVKSNCCDFLDAPLTSCFRQAERVEAKLEDQSVDYLAFQYTDAITSTKTALEAGQKVLVTVSGGFELQTFTGSGYVTENRNAGDGIEDANVARAQDAGATPSLGSDGTVGGTRYAFRANGQPLFTDTLTILTDTFDQAEGRRLIVGSAWAESIIDVFVNTTDGGGAILVASGLGSELIGDGIYYDAPAGSESVYFIANTLCGPIGGSALYQYPFGGVGTGGIGSTFAVG